MTDPPYGWLSGGLRLGDLWGRLSGDPVYRIHAINQAPNGTEVELRRAGSPPIFVDSKTLVFSWDRLSK